MAPPRLRLVASSPLPVTSPRKNGMREGREPDFFKSAQWSADGTTLITSTNSYHIHTYVLPEKLLANSSPAKLQPQGVISLPEPSSALAPSPFFALEYPATHLSLTASTDHPIHMRQLLPHFSKDAKFQKEKPLASFNLIQPTTERYFPVRSLIWTSPGQYFIAGTSNLIALYDIYSGSKEPIVCTPTLHSARLMSKGGGVGMRGMVAALAVQTGSSGETGLGLVAAGTWTRHVGLYDLKRTGGECVATWSVARAAVVGDTKDAGRGVVQTKWSPCGSHLLVNERKANRMLVYDIRFTKRLLAWLDGRVADTNQHLKADVYQGTGKGFEVWGGTTNGRVLAYDGVGSTQGKMDAVQEWEGHDTGVGSAAMHPSGSVLATCSGSWEWRDIERPEMSNLEQELCQGSSEIVSDSSNSPSGSDHERTVAGQMLIPRTRVRETSLKVWSISSCLEEERKITEVEEGE